MRYIPTVVDVKIIPEDPTPEEEVHVYARVFDDYANIVNATLLYRVDGKQIYRIPMEMINGIGSNGTYTAVIPPYQNNSTVEYTFHFLDELGYRYLGKSYCSPEAQNQAGYYNENQGLCQTELHKYTVKPIWVSYPVLDESIKSITVRAKGSNITKVNLNYTVKPKELKNQDIEQGKTESLLNRKSEVIPMHRDPYLDGHYEVSIPPLSNNSLMIYYVEVTDKYGNFNRSPVDRYLNVLHVPNSEQYARDYFGYGNYSPPPPTQREIQVYYKMSNINIRDQTAEIQISLRSPSVDYDASTFIPLIW